MYHKSFSSVANKSLARVTKPIVKAPISLKDKKNAVVYKSYNSYQPYVAECISLNFLINGQHLGYLESF